MVTKGEPMAPSVFRTPLRAVERNLRFRTNSSDYVHSNTRAVIDSLNMLYLLCVFRPGAAQSSPHCCSRCFYEGSEERLAWVMMCMRVALGCGGLEGQVRGCNNGLCRLWRIRELVVVVCSHSR